MAICRQPSVIGRYPIDPATGTVLESDRATDADRCWGGDLGPGPVARATAPDLDPALMLDSRWMPDRVGPRPSSNRGSRRRDVLGGLRGIPGVLARLVRVGRSMRTGAADPG